MMQEKETQIVVMRTVLAEVGAYFQHLRKQLVRILLLGVVLSALALGYHFLQKPSFTAEATFILEEKSSGSGLAGLASQFGFDIASMTGSNGIFAGDNVLDILGSRSIMEKVLVSEVNPANNGATRLVDLFIASKELKTKKWQSIPGIDTLSFKGYIAGDRLRDSLLYLVYKEIGKKHLLVDRLNKKGTIIKVTTTSRDEVFSKLFTERLVNATIAYYVGIKTAVAQQQLQRLEKRADSLSAILNAKTYETATQQILDANIAFKTAAVPGELTQRQKTLAYALYTEVTKNLEASRMSLAAQTPVINLLDTPKYPLEDGRKPWFILVLFAWGFVIGAGLLWTFFTYPSVKP